VIFVEAGAGSTRVSCSRGGPGGAGIAAGAERIERDAERVEEGQDPGPPMTCSSTPTSEFIPNVTTCSCGCLSRHRGPLHPLACCLTTSLKSRRRQGLAQRRIADLQCRLFGSERPRRPFCLCLLQTSPAYLQTSTAYGELMNPPDSWPFKRLNMSELPRLRYGDLEISQASHPSHAAQTVATSAREGLRSSLASSSSHLPARRGLVSIDRDCTLACA
jgi:hypothetical protein